MKYLKLSIFGLSFLLFAFLNIHTVFAQTAKVIILPFSIESKTPNQQLQDKIPALIGQLLEKEGAAVEILSETSKPIDTLTSDDISKIGLQSGADYILKGSLFVAGESVSIDSVLLNTFDVSDQRSIFAQAAQMENLFSAVSKVSKEITSVVFQKNFITGLTVTGNQRIENDVILSQIETQAGDILKNQNVSKDLKKIFSMGYFDDVIVKKQSSDEGVSLIYEVKEKATVRRVRFNKNIIFEDDELSEIVNTRTGAILNIHKLKDDINRMRLMYTTKNYHNIQIDYEVLPLENSQADIVFKFEEGEKVQVEKITFEGNTFFSAKEIKKEIKTAEKGFWSFITSSGDLNEIEVRNDVIRIESLYKNNGFIDAKVSDPIVDIGKESISIHFKISEGSQYKVSSIDIVGDLIRPKQELIDLIESQTDELYNREIVRKDIQALSGDYSNQGYANVKINTDIQKDEEKSLMGVVFNIRKGDLVYFDRVLIKGNYKTRDKVIRREVKILEQGLYSKNKIQESFKNLNRLAFFENIDVKPVDTDKQNVKNLEISVTEKQTGAFSVGGGFSSEKSGFFTVSLNERNLFGRGLKGNISAEISGEEVLYNVGLYDPYIFDTNVSAGFNVYKQELEFEHYDKDALGFSLNLGYKLRDYTRVGVRYAIEDFDIQDVETANTNVTPGSFLSSSITPFITYDTRDDLFLPTEGQKHSFSIEYSGNVMGGDIDFIKYLGSTSFYFPLFWKFTGLLHGEAGYVDDQSGDSINIDYEKFYKGGMDSIRGFGDIDINGQRDGETKLRGGEKYVQVNAELFWPLLEQYKIAGVIFYDRGDVYRDSEDIDFADQFSSAGIGIRWDSPVGPIRVDYGWVIEGKDVKDSGSSRFHFAVGASF